MFSCQLIFFLVSPACSLTGLSLGLGGGWFLSWWFRRRCTLDTRAGPFFRIRTLNRIQPVALLHRDQRGPWPPTFFNPGFFSYYIYNYYHSVWCMGPLSFLAQATPLDTAGQVRQFFVGSITFRLLNFLTL